MRHEKAILQAATEEQQRRAIESLTVEDALKLDADFEMWAHENQLPPSAEGWRTWLMMAGRGFGKTRAGAEWIFRLANGRPKVRVALVGATIADARSIMVEGVSGLLTHRRRYRRRLTWEPSLGRLRWPNGSEAQLFSGDNADGLRGPEHDFALGGRTGQMAPGRRRVDEPAVRPETRTKAAGADHDHAAADRAAEKDRRGPFDDQHERPDERQYQPGRKGHRRADRDLRRHADRRPGAGWSAAAGVEGALWPRDLIERARVRLPLPGREGSGVGTSEAECFADQHPAGIEPSGC